VKLRRVQETSLGEAISMEDAMSMLTIIFVLFVVFLVPLISIDKARLEAKLHDSFWDDAVKYLTIETEVNRPAVNKYRTAFELYSPLSEKVSSFKSKAVTIIEHITDDSTLIIIRHNLQDNKFSLLRLTAGGSSSVYQHGELGWSKVGREWFLVNSEIDYGDLNLSKTFNTDYRAWRKKGFISSEN
jgi:hypothetical protein